MESATLANTIRHLAAANVADVRIAQRRTQSSVLSASGLTKNNSCDKIVIHNLFYTSGRSFYE